VSADLVRALNDRAGLALELTGLIDQGQSGAAFVRWPDGRESVVTTAFASLDQMRQTADVLNDVRGLGIPVPRHEFFLEVEPGTVAVVQERMPGSTVEQADTDGVEAVMAINERFAGLLRERKDVLPPPLSLGRSGDPTPSAVVEEHSARARALVARVRATGAGPARDMVGDDLVHVDLTLSNMLFVGATITGVVDWNYGVARGDRYFGLVKLLHTLSFASESPSAGVKPTNAALERVEHVVSSVLHPETLRRYWAHQTLNMLYGSLRWGTSEAFDTYLGMGEARLNT